MQPEGACDALQSDLLLGLRPPSGKSRYCVVALFNRGCIFVQSRLQHSAAPDMTSAEAFAFSFAAIMADVIRGRICDFGFASAVQDPSPILTDNDAIKRIASNAGSEKRSLMVLRRLAFRSAPHRAM